MQAAPLRCCRVELCSTSYSAAIAVRPAHRLSNSRRAGHARRHHALEAAAMEPTNGDGKGSAVAQTAGAETTHPLEARVDELQRQVEKLNALVRLQQGLLEQQQQQMEQQQMQQQQMLGAGLGGPPGPTPHFSPLASGWGMVSTTPQTQSQGSRITPFEAQRIGIGDRRLLGLYDSRFHSTSAGATPKDFRVLPERIFLVRHAESEGNVDNVAYTYIPDSQVPLTSRGHDQARAAGQKIRSIIEQRSSSQDHKMFFYLSPYKRSLQTYESMSMCFAPDNILGVQEEVQLREQDFGNFQDAEGKQHEKAERLRFGRFYYRFPNGESGADVYDRITLFEDHMIRDINAGRFANKTNLVLVTHGLALRVFLMRWFHWTLAQYLMVHNPPNAEPLVLERVPHAIDPKSGASVAWMHTKALYRLDDESMRMLRGCTSDMCQTNIMPRTPLMPLGAANSRHSAQ